MNLLDSFLFGTTLGYEEYGKEVSGIILKTILRRKVKIKKVGLGNSVKHVIVKMANAPQYDWQVRCAEKLLPYQEENFARFLEFYGKKK